MSSRTTRSRHAATLLRRTLIIAVLLPATLALSGCRNADAGRTGIRTVAMSDATLDKTVVAAAYLNPTGEYDNSDKTGYLALIRADGSYTLARNAGIQLGRLSWDDDGLFLADAQSDYLLRPGKKTTVTPSSKAPYQDGLIALADGEHVGAYNVGFTDDGAYKDDIVVTGESNANRKQIVTPSYMPQMASCGNAAYGLQTALPGEPDAPENGGVRLLSLVSGGTITATTVRTNANIMSGNTRGTSNIPCAGSDIVFLSMQYSDNGTPVSASAAQLGHNPNDYLFADPENPSTAQYHTLERWNVTDGRRTVVPLTDEQGKPLRHSMNSMVGALYDERSLQDGIMYWVSGDGEVMGSDVATGKTRTIVDASGGAERTGDLDFWQSNPRMVDFQPGYVDVWQQTGTERKGDVRLLRYDLKRGKRIREIRVSGINAFMNKHGLTDTGFAGRPQAGDDK